MKQLTKTTNTIFLLIIVVSFVTIACDSSPSDSDSDIDSGADSGQSDSDIGMDHDADTEDDGGSKTANYYPLKVGLRWTFSTHNSETFDMEFASEETFHNRHSYKLVTKSIHGTSELYVSTVDSDIYTRHPTADTEWRLFLKMPPQNNHRWISPGSTITHHYEWEDAGDFTTPAGTFSNCFKATITNLDDTYQIFAPNVGIIHSHSNGTWSTLESFQQ